MKKKKTGVIIAVLALAIGFAAVTTSLVIRGSAKIGTNADFEVVFTQAVLDGTDISSTAINASGNTITYNTSNIAIKDEASTLTYTIKNNSKQYDANVTITCTGGDNKDDYYSITQTAPATVTALGNGTGTVKVTMLKNATSTISEQLSCTLTAKAAERTSAAQ